VGGGEEGRIDAFLPEKRGETCQRVGGLYWVFALGKAIFGDALGVSECFWSHAPAHAGKGHSQQASGMLAPIIGSRQASQQ